MKSSAVIASLLFGSFAVAAPVDKRALAYTTEVVTEYVVIYTTVYDDAPVPTTLQGLFYEEPQTTTTADAQPTSAPAPAPVVEQPKVEEPSSVYTPPVVETPAPAPAPVPSPAAAPVVEQPKVEAQPTTEQAAPAPAATSAAAAPAPAPATGGATTSGEKYTDVDITIYDNNGAKGACGTDLYDTDMIVALAQPAWGQSTYDVMTGAATNPWCGQKIQVEYEGTTIQATIMDLCPGCAGHDIDLSLAAWKALTGKDEKTRLKASWSKIA